MFARVHGSIFIIFVTIKCREKARAEISRYKIINKKWKIKTAYTKRTENSAAAQKATN